MPKSPPTGQQDMDTTVNEWEIDFSQELQRLEGMEIISSKLRVRLELLALKFIKQQISSAVAEAEERLLEKLEQELKMDMEQSHDRVSLVAWIRKQQWRLNELSKRGIK